MVEVSADLSKVKTVDDIIVLLHHPLVTPLIHLRRAPPGRSRNNVNEYNSSSSLRCLGGFNDLPTISSAGADTYRSSVQSPIRSSVLPRDLKAEESDMLKGNKYSQFDDCSTFTINWSVVWNVSRGLGRSFGATETSLMSASFLFNLLDRSTWAMETRLVCEAGHFIRKRGHWLMTWVRERCEGNLGASETDDISLTSRLSSRILDGHCGSGWY